MVLQNGKNLYLAVKNQELPRPCPGPQPIWAPLSSCNSAMLCWQKQTKKIEPSPLTKSWIHPWVTLITLIKVLGMLPPNLLSKSVGFTQRGFHFQIKGMGPLINK